MGRHRGLRRASSPPRCSAPTAAPGMLGLYLASPLDRDTYLLAKAAAVGLVLSLVTLGPPLFMLIARTVAGVGPDGLHRVPRGAVAGRRRRRHRRRPCPRRCRWPSPARPPAGPPRRPRIILVTASASARHRRDPGQRRRPRRPCSCSTSSTCRSSSCAGSSARPPGSISTTVDRHLDRDHGDRLRASSRSGAPCSCGSATSRIRVTPMTAIDPMTARRAGVAHRGRGCLEVVRRPRRRLRRVVPRSGRGVTALLGPNGAGKSTHAADAVRADRAVAGHRPRPRRRPPHATSG